MCKWGAQCKMDSVDHFKDFNHPSTHPKFGKTNRFPSYWDRQKAFKSADFIHLHPIDKEKDATFQALNDALQSFEKGPNHDLNYGRDVVGGHPDHKGLKLLAAWRNENIPEWEKYNAQKTKIEREMIRCQKVFVPARDMLG